MPRNPPEGMPRITSCAYYSDPDAAITWLKQAYGFEERLKLADDAGKTIHAELSYEDGLIMVGPSCSEEKKTSPATLDGHMTQGMYIYVDDVDGHCEKTRSAGGEIVMEPVDMFWDDRVCRTLDPEGHLWVFSTHKHDVPMDQM